MLSYKLLWFEDDDPARWPESALAAVTTHDLPTIAGVWSGSDAAEQAELTGTPREELEQSRRDILGRLARAGVPASAGVAAVVEAAHRWLGRAPSILVSATLEDAVAEERRPNIPGTTTRENWRIPLAVPIEDLPGHPTVSALMAGLRASMDDPS
jgi:4-alpha-glucanotransferase